MPLPAFVLRSYGGGAVVAQLVQEIGPSDISFTITPTTGWTEADGNPLGTVGPFTVVIDRFTTSVEKILCTSINLVTGVVQVETSGGSGRGYDRTVPQAHVPGGSTSGVQTCWSSIEAAEANKLVFEYIGQMAATGDIPYASAPSVISALPIGGAGALLESTGTIPSWFAIGVANALLTSTGTAPSWLAPGTTGQVLQMGVSSLGWANVSFSDTGWVNLTLLNGFTTMGASRYRKLNGAVYIQCDQLTAPGSVTSNVFATLPAGFRVNTLVTGAIVETGNYVTADATGDLTILPNATPLGIYDFSFSYPADA
jgi:hypothetical protein